MPTATGAAVMPGGIAKGLASMQDLNDGAEGYKVCAGDAGSGLQAALLVKATDSVMFLHPFFASFPQLVMMCIDVTSMWRGPYGNIYGLP